MDNNNEAKLIEQQAMIISELKAMNTSFSLILTRDITGSALADFYETLTDDTTIRAIENITSLPMRMRFEAFESSLLLVNQILLWK
jgi:hypothetical protein